MDFKEFLKEKRVRAYYLNENYIEEGSNLWTEVIYETKEPFKRTFIITEHDEFTKRDDLNLHFF